MSDTVLIAIDESATASGVAIFVNGTYKESFVVTPDKNADVKIDSMARNLISVLKQYAPDIIVSEKTYEGKGGALGHKYNDYLNGLFKGFALAQKKWVFVDSYYPSEWRALLGIEQSENGKRLKRPEQKKKDIEFVTKHVKLDTHTLISDDEADAICIGLSYIKEWSNKKEPT